jgi:hypothetical protein
MYNLVLSGFKTKEQAEEFLAWYGNQGEQDFEEYLDNQDIDMGFAPVHYNKTPEWFGDNYVAHLKIFKKEE